MLKGQKMMRNTTISSTRGTSSTRDTFSWMLESILMCNCTRKVERTNTARPLLITKISRYPNSVPCKEEICYPCKFWHSLYQAAFLFVQATRQQQTGQWSNRGEVLREMLCCVCLFSFQASITSCLLCS
nr:hypothetical protein Iba_scaffold8881CG0410 [Ipomoea batatas]